MNKIVWTAVLAVLLSAPGCQKDKLVIQTNSPVARKLYEFAERGPRGTYLRLEQTTSFTWDAVFFFLEGTPKADINKVANQPIFPNPQGRLTNPGPLLVFTVNGKPIHADVILPPVFLSGVDRHRYSKDDAVLVVHGKPPGPYSLRFAE
jgi:hypothetical protein